MTFSIASIDWIMSLEPRWASTIFAVYVFAGLLVVRHRLGHADCDPAARHRAARDVVSDSHLHDLGRLLFAFSTFWAYIWVSQYLLIWYGDLPEEIPYYVRRTSRGWLFWFLLNPAINWAVPFLVLLPRAAKRNARVLGGVCVLMLGGHYLDLYLLLAPDILPAPAIGPLELLVPIGYVSLFAVITQRALSSGAAGAATRSVSRRESASSPVNSIEESCTEDDGADPAAADPRGHDLRHVCAGLSASRPRRGIGESDSGSGAVRHRRSRVFPPPYEDTGKASLIPANASRATSASSTSGPDR